MPPPLISLLTDFGTRSPYAGILRGVIHTINPEARVVDLTHEVTPHNLVEAAYLLEASYRYFPERSIHVVVVDPGVGSSRRPILGIGERALYIAPDNGVLSSVFASDSVQNVYHITESHYCLRPVSNTFHGRDIFAPAAAWLSTGIAPENFGEPIRDPVRLELPRPRAEGHALVGEVVHVDRFGNLITNIPRNLLDRVVAKYGFRGFGLQLGGHAVDRHVEHYEQVEPGGVASLYGSSDHLEVSVREGSAAERLGAGIGAAVSLRFFQ